MCRRTRGSREGVAARSAAGVRGAGWPAGTHAGGTRACACALAGAARVLSADARREGWARRARLRVRAPVRRWRRRRSAGDGPRRPPRGSRGREGCGAPRDCGRPLAPSREPRGGCARATRPARGPARTLAGAASVCLRTRGSREGVAPTRRGRRAAGAPARTTRPERPPAQRGRRAAGANGGLRFNSARLGRNEPHSSLRPRTLAGRPARVMDSLQQIEFRFRSAYRSGSMRQRRAATRTVCRR